MKRGFTLIETLVALFILSITITGVFTLITFNVRNAQFIRNSSIASGLAQEGLEVVRNIRDSDWHRGGSTAFGKFNSGGPKPSASYRVQWNADALIDLGSNPKLSKDPSGRYQYDPPGSPTIFNRIVKIDRTSDTSPEIIVTVTVSWNEPSGAKTLNAEEHLYNWFY